jgi:hypothetical protein
LNDIYLSLDFVVNEVWNISADTKAQFLLNNKSLLLAKTHKMLTQIVHINYIYTYLELGNRKKKNKTPRKTNCTN